MVELEQIHVLFVMVDNFAPQAFIVRYDLTDVFTYMLTLTYVFAGVQPKPMNF